MNITLATIILCSRKEIVLYRNGTEIDMQNGSINYFMTTSVSTRGQSSEPPNPNDKIHAVELKNGMKRWHFGAMTDCHLTTEMCSQSQTRTRSLCCNLEQPK